MSAGLDDTAEDTYAAVGLALTEWEALEGALADLYSFFRGTPFERNVVLTFGQRFSTTVKRIAGLERAAARYFIAYPNQDDEGRFGDLMRKVERTSIRRHRIAHGLVDRVTFCTLTGYASGFALLVPWYSELRLRAEPDEAWPSDVIRAEAEAFVSLNRQVMGLTNHLLASRQSPASHGR